MMVLPASRYGDMVYDDVTTMITLYGSKWDQAGKTPLHHACRGGDTMEVKRLLQKSETDINLPAVQFTTEEKRARQHWFSYKSQEKTEDEQNKRGWTPLHVALWEQYCMDGSSKHLNCMYIAKYLLKDPKIDVDIQNDRGHTALHLLCLMSNVSGRNSQMFRWLKKNNPKLNLQDQNGLVALHLAARIGFEEMVDVLLKENELQVDIGDSMGFTPFFLACQHGHLKAVKKLVAHPAVDINAQSFQGRAPFHAACMFDHYDIVVFLLSQKRKSPKKIIKPNIKNSVGRGSIHFAASEGHYRIVELLLAQKGIEIYADKNGLYPIELATQNGHQKIADLIKEKATYLYINEDNNHILSPTPFTHRKKTYTVSLSRKKPKNSTLNTPRTSQPRQNEERTPTPCPTKDLIIGGILFATLVFLFFNPHQ